VALWNSVGSSRNPALIQTYLDQFPQGTFAGAAKIMIDDLKKNQFAAVPAKPDVAPTPTEAAPDMEEVEGAYITVKRANLRDKPLADGKLVKAFDPGVPLTVTGKVRGTQWYRVASADGKLHGFVFGDAIRDIREAEADEWSRIKDAKQSAVIAGFLRRYPSGSHSDQAKAILASLSVEERRLHDLDRSRAEAAQREEQQRRETARRVEEEQRDSERLRAHLPQAQHQVSLMMAGSTDCGPNWFRKLQELQGRVARTAHEIESKMPSTLSNARLLRHDLEAAYEEISRGGVAPACAATVEAGIRALTILTSN
jgi:hypothetical protein